MVKNTNKKTVARIRYNIRDKKPIYGEILNYNKDGQVYWISLTINPILDEHGELHCFISVQANITSKKLHALDTQTRWVAINKSIMSFEWDNNKRLPSLNT